MKSYYSYLLFLDVYYLPLSLYNSGGPIIILKERFLNVLLIDFI